MALSLTQKKPSITEASPRNNNNNCSLAFSKALFQQKIQQKGVSRYHEDNLKGQLSLPEKSPCLMTEVLDEESELPRTACCTDDPQHAGACGYYPYALRRIRKSRSAEETRKNSIGKQKTQRRQWKIDSALAAGKADTGSPSTRVTLAQTNSSTMKKTTTAGSPLSSGRYNASKAGYKSNRK